MAGVPVLRVRWICPWLVWAELDVRQPPGDALEHDAHLHPGEPGAEARVATPGEGEVLLGVLALDIEALGVREPALVVVGRAERDEQLRAFPSRLKRSSLPGTRHWRIRSPMRFSPGGSSSMRSTCCSAKRQYSPSARATSTCSSSSGTPQPNVANRAVAALMFSSSDSGTPMKRKAIFAGTSHIRSLTRSASPRRTIRSSASSTRATVLGSRAATRSGVNDLR